MDIRRRLLAWSFLLGGLVAGLTLMIFLPFNGHVHVHAIVQFREGVTRGHLPQSTSFSLGEMECAALLVTSLPVDGEQVERIALTLSNVPCVNRWTNDGWTICPVGAVAEVEDGLKTWLTTSAGLQQAEIISVTIDGWGNTTR